MVHRTREASDKVNKVVYGMASDGETYICLRIDNQSQVSQGLCALKLKEIRRPLASDVSMLMHA